MRKGGRKTKRLYKRKQEWVNESRMKQNEQR